VLYESEISLLPYAIFRELSNLKNSFAVTVIQSVLEKIKHYKLTLNYILIFLKTSFNLPQKIKRCSSLIITLLSSAKKIGIEIWFNTKENH
jgi:hypothetical protein